MALRDFSLSSPFPLLFPDWQREYESALLETDQSTLFTRVEVAEAAILTRRDALEHDSQFKLVASGAGAASSATE